jgi:hypothetical protein
MAQKTTTPVVSSRERWERLEGVVREPIPRVIHALREEEVTALGGRPTSAWRAAVEGAVGRRHGDGQPRPLR